MANMFFIVISFRRLFVFGPCLEYGIDRQLTKYTHGSATVAISAKMGVLLRLKYVQRNSK